MHISPQILRLALLRIFADTDAGAGGSLSFSQINSRWPQTGLRTSDLRDAVREMLDSGDLIGSEWNDTLNLALSPETRRGLSEPYGELYTASFDDEATLFMARNRQHVVSVPGKRQRVGDRNGVAVEAARLN